MIVELEPTNLHEEEEIFTPFDDEDKLGSLSADQLISYVSMNSAFDVTPLVQPCVAELAKIQQLMQSIGILSSLREACHAAQSDGFMRLSRFQYCQALREAIIRDCDDISLSKDRSDKLLAEVCLALALDWGLFDLVHTLATSMESEDHLAVLPLLRSLVSFFESEDIFLSEIIISTNGVITSKHALLGHLKYYLHYLYEGSPTEGTILVEARSLLQRIENLVSDDVESNSDGVEDVELVESLVVATPSGAECVLCKYNVSGHIHPGRERIHQTSIPVMQMLSETRFFDAGSHPKSPVYREIEQYLEQVERDYDTFDRISALVTGVETDKPAMFTSSDVYDAIGAAHDTPSSSRSRASLDQRKQTLEVLNEILMDTSSLLTLDQLFALHRTLIPAASGQAGVLRTSAAVGYASPRIYRMFLPAGEVSDALRRLVDTINDAARWQQRPLLCAYYAFAVLVFYIHPFHDGNGRCARLLGNLVARKLGFPSVLRASDKTIQATEFLQRAVVAVESRSSIRNCVIR